MKKQTPKLIVCAALIASASVVNAQTIKILNEAYTGGSSDLPIAPMPKAAPPVDLSFTINQGELLSEKTKEWAAKHGYTMTWLASDFRSTSALNLSRSFDDTLEDLSEAMKRNGVHLVFEIFQNKAVRVTEIK